MLKRIRGRRIHFAGSANNDVDPNILEYAHNLIKYLVRQILSHEAGLVVQIGSDPRHNSREDLSIIFDWTILEAAEECYVNGTINWPSAQGAPIIAVGLGKALDIIPLERRLLWEKLTSHGCVELYLIDRKISVGGVLREKQVSFGDILVTMGGGPGVNHFFQLYTENKKPVIPLDILLKKEGKGASELLAKDALENPTMFFEYDPPEKGAAAYSRLSLKKRPLTVKEFWARFYNFISHLKKPRAFYVRLQNKDISEFDDVERFFRNVVDKVVWDSGYERYEAGFDPSSETFMNVEIFEKLHYCSLAIVDMTCVRPNCCIELGYALGLNKKVIITACEDTKLPWDIFAIHCHFWSPTDNNDLRIDELKTFMEKNINKGPIVKK